MANKLTLILLLCTNFCFSQKGENQNLLIAEDENVSITLSHLSTADLGEPEWLKLIFKNKTETDLNIITANYSLNQEITNKQGNKYIDKGQFGEGNIFDLIHSLHNIENTSNHSESAKIPTRNSIEAWKYITNYAGSLLDGRKSEGDQCALLDIKITYRKSGQVYELNSQNNEFCFTWKNADSIPTSKLTERLQEIILNPTHRWVNTYITNTLMEKEEVRNSISSTDYIQGILLRENAMTADENILFLGELKRRNAIPSKELTEFYLRRIQKNSTTTKNELEHYWDNQLLYELLKKKYNSRIYRVLELNAKYWSNDPNNSSLVYDYLLQNIDFDLDKSIDQDNVKEWRENIKTMAIARNSSFEKYLHSFLEDQREFEFIDWNRYRRSGMLPKDVQLEKINIRICDMVLVALLRNRGEINFEATPKIGTKIYECNITSHLIDLNNQNQKYYSDFNNNLQLDLFETKITLTPEIYSQLQINK